MKKKYCIVEESDKPIKLSIDESALEVDGQHILAKISGPFFIPNGVSRNGRFYPKELWQNVLGKEELREQLANRTMFGCISHNTPLTDESFRDGKFSHIVTKLGFDEQGNPDCEALILNTPTGKILNTIVRAGSKVFVSTRANGDFKGKTEEGLPIVDKETFDLKTVDFVLRPGFLEASPALSEALEGLIEITEFNIEKKEGEEKMGEKTLLEEVTKKNLKIENDLIDTEKKVDDLKDEVSILKKENTVLKDELDDLKKSNEKLGESANELAEFKKIGSLEEVNQLVVKVGEYNKLSESLGTQAEIDKTLNLLESIAKNHKEISETFGNFDQISEAMDLLEKLVKEKEDEKKDKEVQEMADKYDLDKKVVEKIIAKFEGEEADDMLKLLSKKDDKEGEEEVEEKKKGKKKNEEEDKEKEDDKEDKEDDKKVEEKKSKKESDDDFKKDDEENEEDDDKEDDEEPKKDESFASRLFESFSR